MEIDLNSEKIKRKEKRTHHQNMVFAQEGGKR